MPVDKQVLEAAIAEASKGDDELAGLLRDRLSKNETAAASFAAGFMRNADYTQKTQSLADERKKFDGQLDTYRQQLEAAEADKAKILKDLANQKVTVAQARARLQAVKDTYQLSDDDIPPVGDLIDTRKTGRPVDSTPDLDEKLAAFKNDIFKEISGKIVPELAGVAQLTPIWMSMASEHQQLTGKQLTYAEQQAILKTASESSRPLMSVWEEKYNIPAERRRVEHETVVKEARAKWDAEQTARRSEEALQAVRPGVDNSRLSPVLRKGFTERGHDPVDPGKHQPNDNMRRMPSAEDRSKLSGAERAATKFMERRAAGVPMGAKEPAGKTA